MHSNLWKLFSWSNELEEQLLRELNEWPQATDLIFGHAKDVPSSSQGKSKHEWYAELEYELFNEDLHLSWVWRQDPSIPDRHRKLEQSKMRGKISNQYIPRSRPIIPFGSSISNIFKTRKTWQKTNHAKTSFILAWVRASYLLYHNSGTKPNSQFTSLPYPARPLGRRCRWLLHRLLPDFLFLHVFHKKKMTLLSQNEEKHWWRPIGLIGRGRWLKNWR